MNLCVYAGAVALRSNSDVLEVTLSQSWRQSRTSRLGIVDLLAKLLRRIHYSCYYWVVVYWILISNISYSTYLLIIEMCNLS